MLFTSSLPLPSVATLPECASWTLTVSPYIHQLQQLPVQILEAGFSREALTSVYLSTNPLIAGFAFSLFLAPIFLVVSEINKNYSQVDRLWSILPTLYIAHFTAWAHLAGIPTKRLDNLIAVSCVWSIRLTFNYWRKGGYSIGSEDYRWELLRARIPRPLFFVFNVLFISIAQSVLLFSITTPAYVLTLVGQLTGDVMNTSDLVFSRTFFALVMLEFLADQQQWNYQNAKKHYQTTAKAPQGYKGSDLERGFVITGLWSVSRHPNFAAEQAVWFVLYQWSCYETFVMLSWTFAGAMSYLFLFQASTWFTELVTAGKYPEYNEYQRQVGKFLPKLRAAYKAPKGEGVGGSKGPQVGGKVVDAKKKVAGKKGK